MYIQCTKALLERMKLNNADLAELPADDGAGGFFSWHANMITLNRKKTIIFINNLTRFPLIVYGCKGSDFDHLDKIFISALRAVFEKEGIPDSYTEEYIRRCGDARFAKTSDRKVIGSVSIVGRYLSETPHVLEYGEQIQISMSRYLANSPFKVGSEFAYPKELMVDNLAAMREIDESKDACEIKGYQLKIRLFLENGEVWRRILIPARKDFCSLHNAIQSVFGWKNRRMYEFIVLDTENMAEEDWKCRSCPVKMYIQDDSNRDIYDFCDDGAEVINSKLVTLEEVFSHTDRCLYIYDFGDSWDQVIELEKTVIMDSRDYVLIESCGKTPADDIGKA